MAVLPGERRLLEWNHPMTRNACRNGVTAVCGALLSLLTLSGVLHGDDRAQEIIAQSKLAGGVVVHVHGADSSLLQSIRQQSPNVLGHLLVAQEADAQKARKKLVAAGQHGKIHVGVWQSGTLPFIDNFVNLLIVERADAVSREEVLRVLAPEGTAFLGSEKLFKPRPATMDDWPMQLYDASGNAVSKDKALTASIAASCNGSADRAGHVITTKCPVFPPASAVTTKSSTSSTKGSTYSPYLPCRWMLIARDAFNGTVLWKQPIERWTGNLYALEKRAGHAASSAGRRRKASLRHTRASKRRSRSWPPAPARFCGLIAGTEGTEEIIHEDGLPLPGRRHE